MLIFLCGLSSSHNIPPSSFAVAWGQTRHQFGHRTSGNACGTFSRAAGNVQVPPPHMPGQRVGTTCLQQHWRLHCGVPVPGACKRGHSSRVPTLWQLCLTRHDLSMNPTWQVHQCCPLESSTLQCLSSRKEARAASQRNVPATRNLAGPHVVLPGNRWLLSHRHQ